MDDQEREVFDQILHTKLRDYLPADQYSMDALDILALDVAKMGANASEHQSFVYEALNGRAVFSLESWYENEETAVTVLMGEDEDNDEEAFSIVFGNDNTLETYTLDDDFADDAREVMHCFAADRKLTVEEKTMAMHIGSLIVVGQAEYVPKLYVADGRGLVHISDMIKSTVQRLAVCTRHVRKYSYAIDDKRSLHAGISVVVDSDDTNRPISHESLVVSFNDTELGRRYVYERNEDGNRNLYVNPLLSRDHEPLSDPQIQGFTNYNVELLTDLLMQRLFCNEANEQG